CVQWRRSSRSGAMADRAKFIRESMRQSWGQRTAAYTRYAAPRTAAYTEVLLAKVALQPGERVLDVATGPGVVAVAAAKAVGPRGGGRLGVVVWSTAEKVTCFCVSNRLLAPLVPTPPADQQLPGPLELGEPGLLERLLAEAGFREPAVERHTLDYVLDDPEEMW